MFKNPYPERCVFKQDNKSLSISGVHPIEVETGNTFLSADRRAEYFSGRRCAHAAMLEEGYPLLPILRNPDRSPVWPLRVVGSITHGASIAAALIKKRGEANVIGLGLDVEDLSREIRSDISKTTLTDWERDHWSVANMSTSKEARIIFSIKETIYKCLFPIHNIYLGFHDAEITAIDKNDFTARLLKNPFKRKIDLPLELTGKYEISDQIVMSALLVDFDMIQAVSG